MAFAQPKLSSQLMNQTGMGRPGGSASKGSQPIPSTQGGNFAAMEQALLKSKAPNPKKLSGSKGGRQFFNKAAGGDQGGPKIRGTIASNPTVLASLAAKKFKSKIS